MSSSRAQLAAGLAPVRSSPRGDVLLILVCALVLCAAAGLEFAGDHLAVPGGSPLGGVCILRALTDVACPFCGMTRSVVAFVHGDLAGAWGYHPGGPLVAALAAGTLVAAIPAAVIGARPLASRPGYWRTVETVALVCLLAGVARHFW
ncbi:DUF2752 domain-containing protein [Haliangium sp.]|uniref:DUF2752 domain-containing protein n=1 Tax=Haliangium sp. TaxID=2663208 RepID=UPI003D0C7F89